MNKQRKAIWDKSGGKCWYCGCDLPEKGWHADHVEPVVRKSGIMRKPLNDHDENLVPCCPSCNIQKGSLTVEQFRKKIAKFVNSLNKFNTTYAVAKRYGLIVETGKPVKFWFERSERL